MVDRKEVPREVVQTILAMATEGGPVPVPPPILAALCRAWLALDSGQVETVREATFFDGHRVGKLIATTDQSMIGQRVRIVKEVCE